MQGSMPIFWGLRCVPLATADLAEPIIVKASVAADDVSVLVLIEAEICVKIICESFLAFVWDQPNVGSSSGGPVEKNWPRCSRPKMTDRPFSGRR